jgi:type I restriction-modification system DNA methylase subunit
MNVTNKVSDVVNMAFGRAGDRYPDLFRRHNAFSWYRPGEDVLINALYDLANTYLGNLSDDVLGEVYQRQLARVDRKQLGQYYTPRDAIRLMWDLVGIDRLADQADAEDRSLRILDIATGSGGFLVHGAARLRNRYLDARRAGATQDAKAWVTDATDGLTGCEIQQFSAYLAEVNLVLQFSPLLRGDTDLRLPPLRIHCADSLTLHNPDQTALADPTADGPVHDDSGLQARAEIALRQDSLDRLRDPHASGEWADVAIGNPPYVGEKSIAATMAALQKSHPYWRKFSAAHADYLYNFLILGVSKLRRGGRFAFITTEYWLKATGAAPLRDYLAQHTPGRLQSR